VSWIDHIISRCPVSDDTKVRVRFRTGRVSKWTYDAKQLRWTQTGDDHDIRAYRTVGEA
jgi:hypothetical protein